MYLRDIFNIIHLINFWGSVYKYLSFPSTSTRHVNFLVKIRMVYNLFIYMPYSSELFSFVDLDKKHSPCLTPMFKFCSL